MPGRSGIGVLIPERGTPEHLAACLASLAEAARATTEAIAVRVVVNGCDPAPYADLAMHHPGVVWEFEPRALGYGGAIERGLQGIEQDWVYLLNSDMVLAPEALATLLPWRDDRTFAIASQIFFSDPDRRREETGWTDFRISAGMTEHFDRTPEGKSVRGHLYAGGGASLFRTDLLRRYASATGMYAPFYFEDADWGVQAGRAGWAVKFCPASVVTHAHRATIGRFYEAAEIARIVRRNQLQFEARHGFGGRAKLLEGETRATRRELTAPAILVRNLVERWHTGRARRHGYVPEAACSSIFPRPFRPALPVILLADSSPNGALALNSARYDALVAHAGNLSECANVVLVIAALPPDRDGDALSSTPFAAVHLTPPDPGLAADDPAVASIAARQGRSPAFLVTLRWWIRVYQPGKVELDPDLRTASLDPQQ